MSKDLDVRHCQKNFSKWAWMHSSLRTSVRRTRNQGLDTNTLTMTTIAAEKIVQITSQPLVGTLPGPVDDGSSSGLSDPDDRTGNEDGNDAQDVEEDGSDVYDTEAETERLEETPRTQRNVLLTPSVTTLVQHRGSRTGEEQREETPTGKSHNHIRIA